MIIPSYLYESFKQTVKERKKQPVGIFCVYPVQTGLRASVMRIRKAQ